MNKKFDGNFPWSPVLNSIPEKGIAIARSILNEKSPFHSFQKEEKKP